MSSDLAEAGGLATRERIGSWLAERVGYYLERSAESIDPAAPLSQYGLDSVYAFALCGDIEDLLEISVEPTLVWDCNTVNALTEHLCETLAVG
jgi:acyl carrier protein